MARRIGTVIVGLGLAAGILLDPVAGSVAPARADGGPGMPPAVVRAAAAPIVDGGIGAAVPAGRVSSATASGTGVAGTAVATTSTGGVVARRVIYPRLHINLPIRQAPRNGHPRERIAYHHRASGWPGSGQSTYLYGHARVGTFLALWRARKGDVVYLVLVTGRRVKYRVYAKLRVAWYDRTWIYKRTEMLALQTCIGRNPKGPRLIVLARPVR